MKKKNKKKSKAKNKKVFLIIGSFLVLSIILTLGIILIINANKPIDEVWGQIYYVYLKDNDVLKNKNNKIKFVNTKEQKDPVMVLENDKETKMYFIEDKKVNEINFDKKVNVELLYDLKSDSYDYYFYTENKSSYFYQSIDKEITSILSNEEIKPMEYQKTTKTIKLDDQSEYTYSAFDEIFLKVEVKDNYTNLTDKIKLKSDIKMSIESYKPIDDYITEDVKTAVSKRKTVLKKVIEKENQDAINNFYNKVKGYYCFNRSDGYECVRIIKSKKKIKYEDFLYATEFGVLETVKETKNLGNNVFELTLKRTTVKIDISDINNKHIKIDGDKFLYVGKTIDDVDKWFWKVAE